MKAISLLLAAGCFVPAFAQSSVIAQGQVVQKDFGFYWQTRMEPPTPPMANALGYASGTNAKGNIYRAMIDRSQRTYFGYEVHVEALPQGSQYRVAFSRLDLDTQTLKAIHIDDPDRWKQLDLGPPSPRPLYPFRDAPDTVRALDVIAVDLLVNQQTGQRIVDYVVIQGPSQTWSFDRFSPPQQREFSYTPGTARDFSVGDVSLNLREPRVSINGRLDDAATHSLGEISGTAVWFYVPNHGRYLLSLIPRPELGFRKAGEVRGTSLTFTLGADKITVNSAKPIAPGNAAFNLYVLQDPAWKPNYPNADVSAFLMGAADRAEMLLQR